MKRITTFIILATYCLVLSAQVPQGFKYQTVVRDNLGDIMANKLISLKISIISGSPTGTAVYSETHNLATNDYGIVNLIVGDGTVLSGNFAAINWGANEYFVKTELDTDGGTNFQFMGTSQLLSVPYALYAEKSANAADDFDKDSTNELQTISKVGSTVSLSNSGGSFTDSDNQTLSLNGTQLEISNGNSVTLSGIVDLDWDPANELQILTLHDDTLYVSQGNYVLLPPDTDFDTTNELQTITEVGSIITLSNGGGSVTDDDNQNLSNTTNGTQRTINISGGTSTMIDVADNDNSSTNELQLLSFSNDTLRLSNGNYVVLPLGDIIPSGTCLSSDNPDPPAGYSYSGNFTQTFESNWVNRQGNQYNRANESACIVTANGKLYVIGGYFNSNHSNRIEEYNPVSNTWTTKADMPTSRSYASAQVVNNKIYVIGGQTLSGATNIVEEFDISGNSWSTKNPMPTARSYLKTVVINNKIYAIGGLNIVERAETEEYNPSTNTWTPKADMPTSGRYQFGIHEVAGKIYIVGGNDMWGFSDLVSEFDPVNNLWTSKTPIPTIRGGDFGSAVIDSIIYVIGGDLGGPLDVVEAFDPSNNTWVTKNPMPNPRMMFGYAADRNQIFIIGGLNPNPCNTVDSYLPSNDAWFPRNNLASNMDWHYGLILNGKLYSYSSYMTRLEEYFLPTIYFLYCKD